MSTITKNNIAKNISKNNKNIPIEKINHCCDIIDKCIQEDLSFNSDIIIKNFGTLSPVIMEGRRHYDVNERLWGKCKNFMRVKFYSSEVFEALINNQLRFFAEGAKRNIKRFKR